MTTIIHPKVSDSEFNKLILELGRLVARHGIESHMPEKDNILSMQLFRNSVHDGWKKAQDIACGELLRLLDEKSEIEIKIKERKRNKQKDSVDGLRKALDVIDIRVKKIQYVFGSIVWTLFGMRDYVVRRFYRESSSNINRKSLGELYVVADEFNKNSSDVAILCDLTTFMHVGDLVVVGKVNGREGISIAEVKQGKRNFELMEVIQNFEKNQCEYFLHSAFGGFSEADKKQFERIIRQKMAMSQVQEVLDRDAGTDLRTGLNVKLMGDDDFVPDSYADEINKAYESLVDGKEWAIGGSDGCVFFGMYKGEMRKAGPYAFKVWMDDIEAKGPLLRYSSCFYADTARPILTQPINGDLIDDILTGQIDIYFCVCFEKLVSRCNDIGVSARFLPRKQSAKIYAQTKELIMHDGQLISIAKSDNAEGAPGMFLGGGVLHRIIFNFNRPLPLLERFASDIPESVAPTNDGE